MKIHPLVLTALAAATVCAGAVPAMASDTQKESLSISYGDLDLESANGRAELSRRFDQAAREKCGISADAKPNYSARICFKNTSQQYQQFAAAIFATHDRKSRLALR